MSNIIAKAGFPMSIIDTKLRSLDIALPETSAPAGNYVPFVVTGSLVMISGQLCTWNGTRPYVGRVGAEVSVEDAVKAARISGLNLIAWLKAACDGDLDRVVRCVRLGGFVNSAPDFFEQPRVINGCSDLMVEVFGDAGRHARAAVGAQLPFNVAVEIDGIFEIKA
jgi:enamine deaminase RidA (YjgF/YER057c/UK114 family)